MHHSHLHKTYPFGKSPDRQAKRELKEARLDRKAGTHHSELAEPGYALKLTPRQSKVWQAIKRMQVKRTRARKCDQDGEPLPVA